MGNNRATLAAFLIAVTLGAPVSAQTPPRVDIPPAQPLSAEPRIAYPGNVTGLQSVVFKIVPGYRPITLDLYAKSPGGEAKPAILWVHGGGWRQGTTRSNPGYADWTNLLAGIAARWLRKNANLYGIDPQRIVIWGASSGAHLAALAATSCDDHSLDDPASDAAISPCVQAAVDWFGPTDFALALKPPAPGVKPTSPSVIADMEEFLGCHLAQCPEATMRAVNPIAYVSARTPPFLIMHGTADQTVSIADSNALDAELRDKGADVQMIAYPGLAHGFAGASPEQKRAILETVISFMQTKTDMQKSTGR